MPPPPEPTAPVARPARVEQVTREQPPTESDRPETSFEDLLGGRILAWLGGLAIVVGVVFFLVIAVDRGWIGVEARVALAFAGSTILLAAGLFLYERRGQTEAAVAAVASALAALYASLTYATAVQEVIGQEAGLLVAGVVGGAGAAIAVRWNSQFVAALALLGALAAPVLVGGETTGLSLAFMVVALVATVGALLWQRWGWLALGAFLVSAPQLVYWSWDRDDLLLPLAMLALYWCLFVVAAIGYELRVPVSTLRVSSASVLLLNAALATALGWTLVDDRGSSQGATAWVLGVTVSYIVLGSVGFRQRMSTEIAALLVAVGVGLSGVTLALALDGPALVAGWSAEAVILAWVARRTGEQRALVFSFVFLGLAALHTRRRRGAAGLAHRRRGRSSRRGRRGSLCRHCGTARQPARGARRRPARVVGRRLRRDSLRRVTHDRGPAPGRRSRAVAVGAGRAEHVLGHRRARRDRRRARRATSASFATAGWRSSA